LGGKERHPSFFLMKQKRMPFSVNTQLQYKIDCLLSNYKQRVERNEWIFPTFKNCCPICKAANCATRHGYYERGVIEEDGILVQIPIARFICHRKGRVSSSAAKTFSLLPHVLIPYRHYSASVCYASFKLFIEGGVNKVLDTLQPTLENYCDRMVRCIVILFQIAFHLLMQANFMDHSSAWQHSLITFIDSYEGGVQEVAFAFYISENTFLLGLSSQLRKRKKLWTECPQRVNKKKEPKISNLNAFSHAFSNQQVSELPHFGRNLCFRHCPI